MMAWKLHSVLRNSDILGKEWEIDILSSIYFKDLFF